ncbi:MAG: hypothetical protein OXC01_03695 [Immundisolibacterales bacterium]|nr:hypothetical protein [Immundisolibacterales bacterium]
MKTDLGERERLHRLIDAVPAGELGAVERCLELFSECGDAFLQALMRAPETAEPLSDEDHEALEEGRRALRADDCVSDRELRSELGI